LIDEVPSEVEEQRPCMESQGQCEAAFINAHKIFMFYWRCAHISVLLLAKYCDEHICMSVSKHTWKTT